MVKDSSVPSSKCWETADDIDSSAPSSKCWETADDIDTTWPCRGLIHGDADKQRKKTCASCYASQRVEADSRSSAALSRASRIRGWLPRCTQSHGSTISTCWRAGAAKKQLLQHKGLRMHAM
jgi:hypothetical protein